MATIGMCNMNDSESRGPLTADDLREHWPPRIPRRSRVSASGAGGLLLMLVSAAAVVCGLVSVWLAF